VPGSARIYTQSQIDSFNDPPDWFPEEHLPMPDIVAHGKGSPVRACDGRSNDDIGLLRCMGVQTKAARTAVRVRDPKIPSCIY